MGFTITNIYNKTLTARDLDSKYLEWNLVVCDAGSATLCGMVKSLTFATLGDSFVSAVRREEVLILLT